MTRMMKKKMPLMNNKKMLSKTSEDKVKMMKMKKKRRKRLPGSQMEKLPTKSESEVVVPHLDLMTLS